VIGEKERYHGAALARLVQDAQCPVRLEFLGGSAYRVNSTRYLYLKYSTKRLSPWKFVFSEDHVGELAALTRLRGRTVVGMVCGSEGIAAVYWSELRAAFLGRSASAFSVTVSRRDGRQFRVRSRREDPLLVPDVDFVRFACDS
jgi:hypothetical protein